jgi:hypothetical protein
VSRQELILEIQKIEDFVWRYNEDFLAVFASADTEELMSLTFNSTHAKFLLRTRDHKFVSSQTTMKLLFEWMDKFR